MKLDTHECAKPDIVSAILQLMTAIPEGVSPDVLIRIEAQIRMEYGGQRHYVQKTKRQTSTEKRRAVFREGLTKASDAEIIGRHNISKSTLYRIMKQGGG